MQREKLRKANIGKKHSEETKKKLSEITKQKAKDPEYRKKISEAVKRNWILRKQRINREMEV